MLDYVEKLRCYESGDASILAVPPKDRFGARSKFLCAKFYIYKPDKNNSQALTWY